MVNMATKAERIITRDKIDFNKKICIALPQISKGE